MQIGFVNFNTDEKKRIAEMMQLLREPEAVEELGIGRVRDHFSNTLFPGTSSLQHHAKYFVVLPWIYDNAINSKERFKDRAAVDAYIRQQEVRLTLRLAKANRDDNGITGKSFVEDYVDQEVDLDKIDYKKYVKYNPTYIYSSGMYRYGIVSDSNIERLIMTLNARKHVELTEESEERKGFSDDLKTCGIDYVQDSQDGLSLNLTEDEARFLRGRIVTNCQGTMLEKLILSGSTMPESYFDLDDPEKHGIDLKEFPEIADVYHQSVLFSRFVHLLDWRYNYVYYKSFYGGDQDQQYLERANACDEAYDALLADMKSLDGYEVLFDEIETIDPKLTKFFRKCYAAIVDGSQEAKDRLDMFVRDREEEVKKKRKKIGNKDYKGKKRSDPQPIQFRWPTVRTIVRELAEALNPNTSK